MYLSCELSLEPSVPYHGSLSWFLHLLQGNAQNPFTHLDGEGPNSESSDVLPWEITQWLPPGLVTGGKVTNFILSG